MVVRPERDRDRPPPARPEGWVGRRAMLPNVPSSPNVEFMRSLKVREIPASISPGRGPAGEGASCLRRTRAAEEGASPGGSLFQMDTCYISSWSKSLKAGGPLKSIWCHSRRRHGSCLIISQCPILHVRTHDGRCAGDRRPSQASRPWDLDAQCTCPVRGPAAPTAGPGGPSCGLERRILELEPPGHAWSDHTYRYVVDVLYK